MVETETSTWAEMMGEANTGYPESQQSKGLSDLCQSVFCNQTIKPYFLSALQIGKKV